MLLSAIATPMATEAQTSSRYHVSEMSVGQKGGNLSVGAMINPKDYNLKTNQRVEITPVLRSLTSNDMIELPTFTVAGRNAYYTLLRSKDVPGLLMRSGHGEPVRYTAELPWQNWMEYSRLEFVESTQGCCGAPTAPTVAVPVADLDYRPQEYTATYHYKMPAAEGTKTRHLEGRAYVTFPVGKMVINPDYMSNPEELKKITSTIDSVRYNPDATVKSITLTGYASPEGAYATNVKLAAGRTEAVKEYVRKQYTFAPAVFHTNSVPEDWSGLREYVAGSTLEDKDAILDFIDNGGVAIEKRNDELRKRFPTSYAYLLKNVYPKLRHTDYAIDFEIRSYTDVDEIKKVIKTRPANLSLNELFLAANTYKAGSEEFDQVMELAATLYPENDVANLNAVNSALNRGDVARAKVYQSRIANTPEGVYAAGVIQAIEKDYAGALKSLEKAQSKGVKEADEALTELKRVSGRTPGVTFAPEFSE